MKMGEGKDAIRIQKDLEDRKTILLPRMAKGLAEISYILKKLSRKCEKTGNFEKNKTGYFFETKYILHEKSKKISVLLSYGHNLIDALYCKQQKQKSTEKEKHAETKIFFFCTSK
ncbi:MAG: hypothetical protein Q4D42_09075 [Eubacteriales bacterium]|nr:hypothetical protein [Eubacteriales bacterium]